MADDDTFSGLRVSAPNGVKVYQVTGGKQVPKWLSETNKRKLRKDADYQRRIELVQDLEFSTASSRVRLSGDGNFLAVTRDQLEFEIFRTERVGPANPSQWLGVKTERRLVQCHHIGQHLGLMEQPVEQASHVGPIQVEAAVLGFLVSRSAKKLAPKEIGSGVHPESAIGVTLMEPFEFRFVGNPLKVGLAFVAPHQPGFPRADPKAELDRFHPVIRRPAVE